MIEHRIAHAQPVLQARLPKLLPLVIPAIAASTALTIYWRTCLTEVGWSDAAELSLQAYQLGVTHPPGYPVHSFLGKLFILALGDPATATNLLSAVFASLGAGILAWIGLELTGAWFAGLASGLAFAVIPSVWDIAVATEVYGVNIFFVALALALVLLWFRRRSTVLLWSSAVVLGVSLGSYLANVMLVPGFLFLILRGRASWTHVVLFVLLIAVVAAPILSWSYFRSQTLPPLGTRYVPDTFGRFFQYLSGAQYQTLRLQTASFYQNRLMEQARAFLRAFPVTLLLCGMLGLYLHWKAQRSVCSALLIALAANMGYFSTYGATDFHPMVIPSYLVFSIWVAYGILSLDTVVKGRLGSVAVGAKGTLALTGVSIAALALALDWLGIGRAGLGPFQVLLLLSGGGLVIVALLLRFSGRLGGLEANVGSLLVILVVCIALGAQITFQLDSRLARSRSRHVTAYVFASFDVLPDDALVVASWDKFAPLVYFQKTGGFRPDLTIIERTLGSEPRPRTYSFGTVADWRAYAGRQVHSRPVIVDVQDETVGRSYQFRTIPHGWNQLFPLSP